MKRTQKQEQEYQAAALAILRQFGAQLSEAAYEYTIETQAGVLWVSVRNGCVFTRFDDVARAKALLSHHPMHDRLNPHSGKWNWMGGFDHAGDMLDLEQFQNALRPLLPDGHQPNPNLRRNQPC